MPSATYHVRGLVRAVGLAKAGEILFRRALDLPGRVPVKIGAQEVDVRPAESDLFVLSQVFGWEEYAIEQSRLAALHKIADDWRAAGFTPLIIDAGANVGYSALFFAKLFPGACVLAIEPDRTTFEILVHHVLANSDIKPIHAALWSHGRGLALKTSGNGCWGNQVGEGSGTPSQRLDVLVASIPSGRPLIIKLDIEGAEREVVESCPEVFSKAQCIMVEPHDFKNPNSACLHPLFKVASSKKFDTVLSGENLLLFAVD